MKILLLTFSRTLLKDVLKNRIFHAILKIMVALRTPGVKMASGMQTVVKEGIWRNYCSGRFQPQERVLDVVF